MGIVNCWSVLNATIVGTCMGLLFHKVISIKKLSYKDCMSPYLVILLLIVLRSVLPLDFGQMLIIPSKIVLRVLDDCLQAPIIGGIKLTSMTVAAWMAGATVALIKWSTCAFKIRRTIPLIKQTSRVLPEKYREIARDIGIDPERIRVSKEINTVVTIGSFDYCVVIPDVNYSEQDMINILRHEADHIHHGDILVKVLIHIACCLLWWNPILFLLEKDFSLLIEYRSDDNAVKGYSEMEKLSYVETIEKMAILCGVNMPKCNAAGFTFTCDKSTLTKRAKRILDNCDEKRKWTSAIVYPLAIIFFLGTYTIQAQPFSDPGYIEGEIKITKDNAFLLFTEDGYDLYVDDELLERHIPKKELKIKPYSMLKIRK